MDAISMFADHAIATGFRDLPADAVRAAKIFILDTFGVGLAGSAGPMARELAVASAAWGDGADARVWGVGAAGPRRPRRYATLIRCTTANSIACTKRRWCTP